MKIAVIAASTVPSDTANSIQVMKVCQAISQIGHDVCLIVPGDHPYPWESLASHYGLSTPFEIRWLHCQHHWRRYDLAWNALTFARSWGATLVYTWMLQTAFLARWIQMPVILEIHMLPSGYLGPFLFRHFMRGKGKKRLLIITNALRNALEDRCRIKFSAQEVQIAPMGCEPERYDGLPSPAQAREQLNIPQVTTVGYTGHLYPGRGMDILMHLARHFSDVNFLWVGGRSEDVSNWRSQLQNEALKNIILTGFIENQYIPLYQAAAEILIMPYQEEVSVSSGGDTATVCSPMKMFEYLSAGRAILSSDLAVLREVLNDENAVLCPPYDLEQWHCSLARLLADEALRVRLSTQARVDSLQYSWRARSSRTLEDFV